MEYIIFAAFDHAPFSILLYLLLFAVRNGILEADASLPAEKERTKVNGDIDD